LIKRAGEAISAGRISTICAPVLIRHPPAVPR
jgi:hypothetical protein